MSETADIYFNQHLAGHLYPLDDQSKGVTLGFKYDDAFVNSSQAHPLSLSMPLGATEFSGEKVEHFFNNLLPCGPLLEAMKRQMGYRTSNTVDMLTRLGWDAMGSLQILGHEDGQPNDPRLVLLTKPELAKLLRKDANVSVQALALNVFDGHVRQVMPGSQNKLAVDIEGADIRIPVDGATAQYVAKLPDSRYPHIIINEAFCMLLAEKVDMNVPHTLVYRSTFPILCVARYDRVSDRDQISRIHQEDFYQVKGVDPKYQTSQDGGLGLVDCFKLIRKYSVVPAKDQKSLIGWVIFNYLIGNYKANGKDLNFLYTRRGPCLSPFCGLASTAVYHTGFGQKMALDIGSEVFENRVFKSHWVKLANDIGVNPRLIFEIMGAICRKIRANPIAFKRVLKTSLEEDSLLERIVNEMMRRVAKLEEFSK